MTDRVIDLSDEPARLSVNLSRLVIERHDKPDVTIPLGDLAVLVISHPCVTITQAVLAGIVEAGGSVVVCNSRHIPAAMLLPIESNSTQAERFRKQADAAEPLKKRAWQQLVTAKVRAQGQLLKDLHGDDRGLLALAGRVAPGDAGNVESTAAQRYWPALFADPKFRRDREADDQNRFLNYGYSVLRAIVARAVCASGLHPSFGVHHHNRYDAFALADDVMEPYRPMVDRAVALWVREHGGAGIMDREVKAHLIGALTARLELDGDSRTLFEVITRTTASLAALLEGEQKNLILPEV
jgi:CRISPR-associated protein Cas1